MKNIRFNRALRNVRDAIGFPVWFLRGMAPPDNHYFKIRRIKRIAQEYECETLIETGTFFGQTIASMTGSFKKVLSVELSDELYTRNKSSFKNHKNVVLFRGDSSQRLGEMIDSATGRIIFWLDGHYSAGVTAKGKDITPIVQELLIIRERARTKDCILIDDVRLFTGNSGYPPLSDILELIKGICPDYVISVDHDCLVARPML